MKHTSFKLVIQTLLVCLHNHLWFGPNKSSVHRVRCKYVLALHADSLSPSCPRLPRLLIPGVIVPIRVAVNHLSTVSPCPDLTSVGLGGCVFKTPGAAVCTLWKMFPLFRINISKNFSLPPPNVCSSSRAKMIHLSCCDVPHLPIQTV